MHWFRSPVAFVFRTATYVNVICGLAVMALIAVLPDVLAMMYLPFYGLIWGVLPAWGILGFAICVRWCNRLPVNGHFQTEIKWGLQAVGSYAVLILLLWVFSAVVS